MLTTLRRTVDRRLRLRLLLGALAGFIVAVPLSVLTVWVRNGWGPLRRLDRSVAGWFHAAVVDRPGVVGFFKAIDVICHPNVFRLLVVALVAVLLWRQAYRLAWWSAVTMAAGSLLGFSLKLVFSRARPDLPDAIASAPGYSFPSGHSLNSAVGMAVLLLVLIPALVRGRWTRLAAWTAGVAVVILTGVDRLALGVHYLSDVVGAWLLAVALVAATTAAFEIWRVSTGRQVTDPFEDGMDPDESRRLV